MVKTTGKTHIVGGVLTGLIVTQVLDVNAGYSLVAGVSALLPDIDQPTSKIGRKVPGSFLIKLIFGHRGFWHSLLATFLLYIIVNAFLPQYLAILVVAGYLSHLFLDMLTPAGVPLLYPIGKRFSIPIAKTGSITEYILSMIMLATGIVLFFT